jgi:putative restriction endonuclease
VEADGPDVMSNGLALTGTVHWMFDRGLVAIADDMSVLVSHNKVPAEWRTALPQLGGKLRLPSTQRDMPHPKFLAWHRENRFRAATQT